MPETGELEKIGILGTDVQHLISTIDHNLQSDGAHSRYQRKVAYDNLPAEVLPKFRAFSAEKAQSMLEEFDIWLASHDRDRNPHVEGTGRMSAGIGIYYFEHDADNEKAEGESND